MRNYHTERQPSQIEQALAMLGSLDQHRLAAAQIAQQEQERPLQQRMRELQLQEMENPNSPTRLGGYAHILDAIGTVSPFLNQAPTQNMMRQFGIPGAEAENSGAAALRQLMMNDPRGAELLRQMMPLLQSSPQQ